MQRATTYVGEALQWTSGISAASTSSPVEADGTPLLGEATVATAARRPRVLWADDNADMRDYVGRLLGTCYDVMTVSDRTTALATALAKPPDLILSDIMMPGLDGFGLLRELRANQRTRTIPDDSAVGSRRRA